MVIYARLLAMRKMEQLYMTLNMTGQKYFPIWSKYVLDLDQSAALNLVT